MYHIFYYPTPRTFTMAFGKSWAPFKKFETSSRKLEEISQFTALFSTFICDSKQDFNRKPSWQVILKTKQGFKLKAIKAKRPNISVSASSKKVSEKET